MKKSNFIYRITFGKGGMLNNQFEDTLTLAIRLLRELISDGYETVIITKVDRKTLK